MERNEIVYKTRALYLDIKHRGNTGGWTLKKEEFNFQQDGEDLLIEIACEPYSDLDADLQGKEELDFELLSTSLEELERKGIPPPGESYRQDVQVIKSEVGGFFRFYLVLKHLDTIKY
jgi:hypothetical protein